MIYPKMMLSIIKYFFVIINLLLISACNNQSPELNLHYTILPSKVATYNLAPVTEVFSLQCTHCRSIENILPELSQLIKEPIEKFHVLYDDYNFFATAMFYSAKAQFTQPIPAEFMQRLFDIIQTPSNVNEDNHSHDYDNDPVAKIEKLFHQYQMQSPFTLTPELIDQVTKLTQHAQQITKAAQLNAAPAFIIKGKYLIDITAHKSVEQLAHTINFLLQK